MIEDVTENPFVRYNEAQETEAQVIPKFKHTISKTIKVSEEAYTHLNALAQRFTGRENSISELLEQIGLCALHLEQPKYTVDEESGTTTEQCRQSGFEDGFHGENTIFLQLYGRLKGEFQSAYIRGWYEGRYIRITRNRK